MDYIIKPFWEIDEDAVAMEFDERWCPIQSMVTNWHAYYTYHANYTREV